MLTEKDAAEVNQAILDRLHEIRAVDVVEGINESRRLGIEESLTDTAIWPDSKDIRVKLKQVAQTRRRPPNEREVLQIILERLYGRLITLPSLRSSISKQLGTENVVWRVDTEFVSSGTIPEVDLVALSPGNLEAVQLSWNRLQKLLENSNLPEKTE